MTDFIPVNTPRLEGQELNYLKDCIETGWVSSEGPYVEKFEAAVAGLARRDHAVAVSSGTAALDVAVAALGLAPGDEIIMPSFTIISCASAVVRAGAVPVLVDCEPDSWTMDVSQVESQITSRTRAIMAVHIYGLPVNMAPLLDIANKHGLKIIEDAAEAIGQTCDGQPCGSFGDISIFSFYANKHVTTGEGGIVLTNDPELDQRARKLRNLCFEPTRRFVHEELGWNYRITNLQAAVGLAQVEQLPEHIERKRTMGAYYQSRLHDIPSVRQPLEETSYARNDYWVYGLVLEEEHSLDNQEAMRLLAANGIGSRPFFWPMHEQPVFRDMGLFKGQQFPVSEQLARRGFYVPSGLALTQHQMQRVAEEVRDILR